MNKLNKLILLIENISNKKAELVDEGVSFNNSTNSFDLNFEKDNEEDIINLKNNSRSKKPFFNRSGLQLFVGYSFNKKVKGTNEEEIKMLFQNKLKTLDLESKAVEQLVSKAIINLGNVMNLGEIDVIITPKSSGALGNFIAEKLKQKIGSNVILCKDALIKSMANEITISDEAESKIGDKAVQGLRRKIDKSAEVNGDFKMKDVFGPHRKFVRNFYKFKDDTKQEVYNKIKNGKVILIDDYWTSGSTLVEINNILKDLGNKDSLAMVLIASSK